MKGPQHGGILEKMFLLIHLLRWFNTVFGLSQPRPNEEKRWAIYLVCMLTFMGGMMFAAVAVLLRLLNNR